MPRVAPFRGLHYAHARFGVEPVPERVRSVDDGEVPPAAVADLTDVACPPYDVIDEAERQGLLARDPHNAVRLEFSAEPDPHARGGRRRSRHGWRTAPSSVAASLRPTTTATARAGARTI